MQVRRIAIVGGGTAGWLCALMLRRYLRDVDALDITVVESSKIPTIGVGEGTTAVFRSLLLDLGVDERTFLTETGATLKYGIKHRDWRRLKHTYDGPIDDPHLVTELAGDIPWLDISAVASGVPVSRHHLFHYLINLDKGPVASMPDGREVAVGPFHYAYHFDQAKVGRYLRKIATGVNTVDATVTSVELSATGDIKSALTDDGNSVDADLYIDCTGFRRALIRELEHYQWHSYAASLPVNRAMPFWLEHKDKKPIPPYTLAWAQKNGWLWCIPTQQRMGCGYVYSDQFTTPDQAQAEIETALGHPIEPRSDIRFGSGRLEKNWTKNCIALGLASSFLEPLEATSIHSTVVQLMLLIGHHCKVVDNKLEFFHRDAFNTAIVNQLDDFREFINLHYVVERRDSAFWQFIASDCITDHNRERIREWQTTMPRKSSFRSMPHALPHVEDQLYYPVLDGLGLLDKSAAKTLLNQHSTERSAARKTITALNKEYRQAASRAITHNAYLTQAVQASE